VQQSRTLALNLILRHAVALTLLVACRQATWLLPVVVAEGGIWNSPKSSEIAYKGLGQSSDLQG
jgi:hypothetical protein